MPSGTLHLTIKGLHSKPKYRVEIYTSNSLNKLLRVSRSSWMSSNPSVTSLGLVQKVNDESDESGGLGELLRVPTVGYWDEPS